MSGDTAMAIYRDIEEQFDNIYSDVIYEAKHCRICEHAEGTWSADDKGLTFFECKIDNNLKCPVVYATLDYLIGYLEAAAQEKNFD